MFKYAAGKWLVLSAVVLIGLSMPAAEAASPDPFPAFQKKVLKIFQDCTYINLFVPHGKGASVDPRGDAKAQWRTMTKEIEKATKSWPVGDNPEAITIRCETTPGRLISVYYLSGTVGMEGSTVGLQVGPAFKQAMDEMVAISQQREAKWAKDPTNPEVWPVNFDQAHAIAKTFLKAAGLDPGTRMQGNGEPPRNGKPPLATITFPGIATMTVNCNDGSILRAQNLSAESSSGAVINKAQAVIIGKRLGAVMGVFGDPSSVQHVTREKKQVWEITWNGPKETKAEVRLDAGTGAFIFAGESIRALHARVPSREEVALPASTPPPPPPAPVMPKSGEVRLSPAQAKQIAAAFAKKMNLPFGGDAIVSYKDPNTEHLKPPTWDVSFHGLSNYWIEANTGDLYHYGDLTAANAARPVRQSEAVKESVAKAVAEKAAQAIGFPKDARFAEVKAGGFANDDMTLWSVHWTRVTPEGIPFVDDALYVLVTADNGLPWTATRNWFSPLPENRKPTVSKRRAIEIAQHYAQEIKRYVEGSTAAAELKVVHPNDYWSMKPKHIRYDEPTRVAWVVTFTQQSEHMVGHEAIFWVDATTEKILGGVQSSRGRGAPSAQEAATAFSAAPPLPVSAPTTAQSSSVWLYYGAGAVVAIIVATILLARKRYA